jgi:hypothetical protein
MGEDLFSAQSTDPCWRLDHEAIEKEGKGVTVYVLFLLEIDRYREREFNLFSYDRWPSLSSSPP